MRARRPVFVILLVMLVAGWSFASAQETAVRPPWDGVSRFTVLIMGIDRRPDEPLTLNYRSDAIMLASYDPATQRIGVLSIPRDMHFAIPDGGDLTRVNALLVRGEGLQTGHGPRYVADTLQYNLGMYIDTTVIFDFEAFTALIDAIGGIEMDVTYTINDRQFPDMDYGYDPFTIQPGHYTFDGETALKYARTRHNDDDYQRGQRQLQVLTAVYQKALDPATLPELIPQIPALMTAFEGRVITDLTPDELLNLARVVRDVPADHITTGALGKDFSLSYVSPQGASIRIPDRDKLVDLMVGIFGDNYAY